MSTDEPQEEGGLHRGLKARHLQLIALGGIIGSGYFLGTGAVLKEAGPGAIFAYLLGGMLVYIVMLCLGELAVHIPIAGSFVTYANQFINPTWGCGVGWSYWLTWVTYVPAEMIAAGIIMNGFVPAVSPVWWALVFALVVTAINLCEVGAFGEMEFWLALLKIVAIIMFTVMAVLILFGWIGTGGAVGMRNLTGEGGLFPFGVGSVLITMVLVLVNFQGSEIIGLAAGESKDPAKSIPTAVTAVSYRIIVLYVIPLFLLMCILPWNDANLTESVFAAALQKYGFPWAGQLFSFVVLTAAISCSNSGLYATSRAMYSLAREGMAPAWLGRVTKKGVPFNAILLSVLGCWIGVMAFVFEPKGAEGEGKLYTTLLSLSGFTGAVAWISICWSQYRFRRRLQKQGYDASKLLFKAPGFPYITLFGIWAQVLCLVALLFTDDPVKKVAFWLSITLLLIPMAWHRIWGHRLQATTYDEKIKGLP